MIQKPSPNYGERKGYKPEIIVIHIMDGTLAGTDSWFANPASQVSSHYGIGFNGEVHQYVQDDKAAWTQGYHQGATFKLHKGPTINPNLYCLSIEHEGTDLSKAPLAQINSSVGLIRALAGKYGISIDRDHIIGHYEVDPIRKPNCPATDKSVLDSLVRQAQGTEELVTIQVPKSRLQKILNFLMNI